MNQKEIFDSFNISIIEKATTDKFYLSAEELVLKSIKNPIIKKRSFLLC
ncbi:MAG: hypothetical protein JSS09_03950 [Verrucomicrobia bacterium]|nr:hypothetical protein [Verrucomicrobiota bacterium]